MTRTTLPVLDLSLLDGDAGEQESFRATLREVTHDVGFFYLVGHGIPQVVIDRAFTTAQAFFELSEEDKQQVDWREQIDIAAERPAWENPAAPAYMRLEGPNLWPPALPGLRTVFEDWEQRCVAVARRLMQAWAVSLGALPDAFDELFQNRPSTLIKLVRYPGRADRGQGVGAHNDPGILTLLIIEPGKDGLQVDHDGGWIDAPAKPGAFVVNIGELKEYATGGYLRATLHRVLSPPEVDTRMSIPFLASRRTPPISSPERLATTCSKPGCVPTRTSRRGTTRIWSAADRRSVTAREAPARIRTRSPTHA